MCTYCNYTHSFICPHATAYVCPECHSILYKGVSYTDNKPQEAFRVEEDMSVFKLGTTLNYGSADYVFAGRFQFFFNNALRNKWILSSEKGDILLMIEQAGFYAICRKDSVNLSKYELGGLTTGSEFVLDEKNSVYVEAMFKNTSTRMEGELFDIDMNGLDFIAIDYSNEKGGYCFAQIFTKNKNQMLSGSSVDFKDLSLKNTRLTNEWL